MNWLTELEHLANKEHLLRLTAAIVTLVIGLFVTRRTSQLVSRLPNLDSQKRMLLLKALNSSLFLLVIAATLNELGFDLHVLLGAAGVLTVAVGFAAQTSASNLISGLFLIVDRPFVVGDFIQVGDIKGEVTAIDLLSCKIRTYDNLLVRIPNEFMQKSNITNMSYFPTRRLDMKLTLDGGTNLPVAEKALRTAASQCSLALAEPAPLIVYLGFTEGGSVSLQFSSWTRNSDLTAYGAQIFSQVQNSLRESGVSFPSGAVQLLSPKT